MTYKKKFIIFHLECDQFEAYNMGVNINKKCALYATELCDETPTVKKVKKDVKKKVKKDKKKKVNKNEKTKISSVTLKDFNINLVHDGCYDIHDGFVVRIFN